MLEIQVVIVGATPRRSPRIATKKQTVTTPVKSKIKDIAKKRLLGKDNFRQIQDIVIEQFNSLEAT
jgi:hypothetical protein